VHGDIKPDNICMRRWPVREEEVNPLYNSVSKSSELPFYYKSEFEFTLIDFGIITKFKVKKT
jgi:hypothetical protein